MADIATRTEPVAEHAPAQPVTDVVQNFAPTEKSTSWSDVATQCWSGSLKECTTAFGKALRDSLGFGNQEAQNELENSGVLPRTRINEGSADMRSPGFIVEWGEKPLQRNAGERRADGDRRTESERRAEGDQGTRPRLELVRRPDGQGIPASGRLPLEPVTDPKILNDVGKRRDGNPIVPTYIGVDNAASYRGADGKKHISAGVPAWLDQPVARSFVMMNEKLAEKGKRVILASEGDSRDGAINSAGRTHTQQAIATGTHAPPGRSEHERGRGLDVRNYQDPDVKAALKEFGFVQGNLSRPGVPIKNDPWHFSFNPKAEPDIERRFGERQARLGRTGAPETIELPSSRPATGERDRTGERNGPVLPDLSGERNRVSERNRHGGRFDTVGEVGKVYELKLDHNTGRHKVDAAVIVPNGYDPEKPTRMLIYNHGFRTDAHAALSYSQLTEQMKSADPQTILVVPEWQANPGSNSSARGRSDQQGFYRGMLNEIMQKTPELRGKTVDDIASMGIIAHSAGYSPAMAQLYKNGLKDKITSVTVLDSMYNPKAYDGWITDNLQDLATGRKQFQLIYTGHLAAQSKGLEARVEQQLARAGLGSESVYKDHKRGGDLVSPETMAQHGFVFKRSEYTARGDGAHGAMTKVYLRQLLDSERRRP